MNKTNMSGHFSIEPNLRFCLTPNTHHVHVRLQGCIEISMSLPPNAVENKVREVIDRPSTKTAFSKIWTEYICFAGSLAAAKCDAPLDSTAEQRIPIKIVPMKSICFQPPYPLQVALPCKEPTSNGQIQVALHNRAVWKIWMTLVARCRELVDLIHLSILRMPIPLRRSDANGSVQLQRILDNLESAKRKRLREE